MSRNYNALYISHHGILGQKWGVRRFQDKNGRLTAAGQKRYKKSETEPDKEKGLTDKQKKALIIGAAAIGTGLAIYGGYKLNQLYTGSSMEIDPISGFRIRKSPLSDEKILSNVNPGRVHYFNKKEKNLEIISGSSTNCMLCSFDYELQKRGYDVRAGLETSGKGFLPKELFSKIYKNFTETDKIWPNTIDDDFPINDTFSKIEKKLLDMGPGSRGNITVWWKYPGGHNLIWENVNGKIVFKDGQTDHVYKDFTKEILQHTNQMKPVEILRTDNLEINFEEAKKYLNTDTIFKNQVYAGTKIAGKVLSDPENQAIMAEMVGFGASVAIAYANSKQQKGGSDNAKPGIEGSNYKVKKRA